MAEVGSGDEMLTADGGVELLCATQKPPKRFNTKACDWPDEQRSTHTLQFWMRQEANRRTLSAG
jgi:hypothetical protein